MSVPEVEMSERLQDKIALHLHMEQEAMFGRRSEDRSAIRALYNDGELLDWLDKMDKAGRIKNTGYINAKITGGFGSGR